MNAILTEPFESHTYKHQSNSAGFLKIIPHPTYETAHTGIEWVCIGPGSILWAFICFVYYILFSWFCHAAVCSVSLQKFVSSLGEERFWDLVTAPQRVLCRLISLRTVTWQVWLGCCIFSFLFFFWVADEKTSHSILHWFAFHIPESCLDAFYVFFSFLMEREPVLHQNSCSSNGTSILE